MATQPSSKIKTTAANLARSAPSGNIAVQDIQTESIVKSATELDTGAGAAIAGANELIKQNTEFYTRDLVAQTKSGLAPEKAAIRTAGYVTHSGGTLGNLNDNVIHASNHIFLVPHH